MLPEAIHSSSSNVHEHQPAPSTGEPHPEPRFAQPFSLSKIINYPLLQHIRAALGGAANTSLSPFMWLFEIFTAAKAQI